MFWSASLFYSYFNKEKHFYRLFYNTFTKNQHMTTQKLTFSFIFTCILSIQNLTAQQIKGDNDSIQNENEVNRAILIGEPTFYKDSLIANSKTVHLATHRRLFTDDTLLSEKNISILDSTGDYIEFNITADFVCLSLVDSSFYNDWDNQIQGYKDQYKNQNVLVVISERDSEQRREFVIEFYNQYLTNKNDYEKAYISALEIISLKYPIFEFKHYYISHI